MVSLVWFRQDLRVSDNPAVAAAFSKDSENILPIYIFDDCAPKQCTIGNNSKIWLHHSLSKLNESLDGNLNIYKGKSSEIILHLITQYDIKYVFWNKCYEPWYIDQENDVKAICVAACVEHESFNGNYLWEPVSIVKDNGEPYKVFTAYKNKSGSFNPRLGIKIPNNHLRFIKEQKNNFTLSDVTLDSDFSWKVGELAVQKKLDDFLRNGLYGYKEGRNYPGQNQVSLLAPYLHFGEISPSQILELMKDTKNNDSDTEHFINELIWREFSCYLLYHFKSIYTENFNSKFNDFAWQDNSDFLECWQYGKTGYPLIDAGMRQLLQTGYMHNRVRMVVASFLVKNLNIHWHYGRDWFWNHLFDADLANNSVNWQWVAGSGVDAAPYFRIFNPIIQGEKFDNNGDYTRKFLPELKNLPNKYLFKPWLAPEDVLNSAGVILGDTYPLPIIDFAESRNKALERYAAIMTKQNYC